jgi:hypothetical protein
MSSPRPAIKASTLDRVSSPLRQSNRRLNHKRVRRAGWEVGRGLILRSWVERELFAEEEILSRERVSGSQSESRQAEQPIGKQV